MAGRSRFDVILTDNEKADFYFLLGPFLSRRIVARELGGPIWDDDGKLWLVALMGNTVLGFCAFRPQKNVIWLCSDYVLPEWRRQGVYNELFAQRFALLHGKYCCAKATASSRWTFERYGFTCTRKHGRYFMMEHDNG
jgi:GNAT superfamily N-acetyltransferase